MEDTVEAALEKYRQRPLGGVVLQGFRRGKYYERCDGGLIFPPIPFKNAFIFHFRPIAGSFNK